MKRLLLLFSLLLSFTANAEVFYDINYFETLGSIKRKYPGAVYEKRKPAWLQPDEAFIKIYGRGMQHTVFVAFSDARETYKQWLRNPAFAGKEDDIRQMINLPDEDSLYVNWVRISYDNPIPIEKFKQKYGKSVCRTNDDFDEVCLFPDRAIEALLTNDKRFVIRADTDFTKPERERGLMSGNK